MTDSRIIEIGPRAIICLETSVRLFKQLKQALSVSDFSSEYILACSRETPADILGLCRRLAPALVVIEDFRIEILPLKQMHDLIARRDIQLLVVSDDETHATCEHLFKIGCTGVLRLDVTVPTLRKAVKAISAGELWMPRRVLSKLAQEAFVKSSVKKLTRRESEVLKLIAVGLTNQQIADQLFISRETVRWHVRSIYSKIGVASRPGAIRYAKHGGDESSLQATGNGVGGSEASK